jgi:hypothetical protein
MKKLELKKMESIQGSTNDRNCMILGFIGAAALIIPGGFIFGAGTLVAAASGDCF